MGIMAKNKSVGVRLEVQEWAAIDIEAKTLGMTRNAYLRMLIVRGRERLIVEYMRTMINELAATTTSRLDKILEVAGENNAYTKARIKSLKPDYLPEVEAQVERIREFVQRTSANANAKELKS